MENKKGKIHTIASIFFALVAVYFIIDSLRYIWIIYSSLYKQVGLLQTLINFMFAAWVARYGIIFLVVPIARLFQEETETELKKLIWDRVRDILLGLALIQITLPILSLFVALILGKIFGFDPEKIHYIYGR